MNTFTVQHLTALVLLLFSVGLWFYDDWRAWAGDDARISRLFLLMTTHAPVTSVLFIFWAGIVVGHLFLPQFPSKTEKS